MKLLIKYEFKKNLRSLLLWGSIITLLSFMMLIIYPVFKESMSGIEEMFELLPKVFLDMFGLGEDGLNFTTAYGWYGIEGYLFVILIGGSYSGILGSSVLAKEEEDKTIEFLLSKPISRNQILFSKISVVVINLLLLNFVLFTTNIIGFLMIDEIKWLTLLFLMIGPLLLQLIFASISLMISVFVTKSRQIISISLGVVMGLYFVNIIATATDKLSFLKYFSPYEYFNAVDLIVNNQIQAVYLLLTFIIITISIFTTWYFYTRKDIIV